MEKLLIGLLATTLYGVVISFGLGRKLDDEVVTRPLVVAGGVLIVIGSYAWYRVDAALFVELFVWFASLSAPMWMRSGLLFLQEREREALARHSIDPRVGGDSYHDGA